MCLVPTVLNILNKSVESWSSLGLLFTDFTTSFKQQEEVKIRREDGGCVPAMQDDQLPQPEHEADGQRVRSQPLRELRRATFCQRSAA